MICDSAVGMALPVPTITVFGNPWRSIISLGPNYHLQRAMGREQRWHRQYNSTRVAVSNFIRQEMSESGIECDVVLPNPVDFSRFKEKKNRFYPPTVLWVGPEIAVKNPEVFNGIKRKMVKDDVQWLVASRDTVGRRSYDQMTDTLSKCSLVLCTSWFEGCSNTLMEAVAAGTPIVTSRSGFFWDFWDERFGERVENLVNPNHFAEAIRTVLANPSKYDPKTAAIEAKIDYETWANAWRKLVVETVDRRRLS
jgi:glycosyltransferase involved in cell wall biosynthesis